MRFSKGAKKLPMFVPDMPVRNAEEDRFQFSQVAQLIFDALQQPIPPHYIALLGPWGSGKSSVLQMMNNLTASSEYRMEIINVWKFADDAPSLHRKIVREVERVLGVTVEDWDAERTHTTSTEGKGLYSLIIPPISLFRKANDSKIPTIIAVVLTLICATFAANSHTPYPMYLTALLWFVLTQSNIQRTAQYSRKILPPVHRDQFEKHFQDAVNNYLRKQKGQRLILVFDDLDRLPPTQLMAALNTIRTFLQSPECVFIVPCDEQVLRAAVRENLKSVSDSDGKSVDLEFTVSEFISKTFDLIVRLPVLEQSNMKRYAKELLERQPVQWSHDDRLSVDRVLSVLIHTGVKTPRQVKGLLNTFGADWNLALKRDSEGGTRHLTAEPLTVAVFSVLKADFPSAYQELSIKPFETIHQWKSGEVSDADLRAFLSRVRDYLPDDPRPFLYFSNGHLNPLTGRPNIKRIRDYLLNAQAEHFIEAFDNLDAADRSLVLAATYDEISVNPGIEVENCITVLIQHPSALQAIPDMYRKDWDLLLRSNDVTLIQYSVLAVAELLGAIDASDHTWKQIGNALSLDDIRIAQHKDELLELWITNEVAAKRLQIEHLDIKLIRAFRKAGEAAKLCESVFRLKPHHSMCTEIDWFNLLFETVTNETNLDLSFRFADWLKKWAELTGEPIHLEMINNLLLGYDFQTADAVEGIGDLWCENYHGVDVTALTHLLKLICHSKFSGFSDENLKFIGNCLAAANNNSDLSGAVEECLSTLWDTDHDRCMRLLQLWSQTRAVALFATQVFEGELSGNEMQVLVDVLKDGANAHNNKAQVWQILTDDLVTARDRRTVANKAAYLMQLLSVHKWRESASDFFPQWFPIQAPTEWMRWNESSVRMTLDLYFKASPTDAAYGEWFLQSILALGHASRGVSNLGLPFQGNANWYLQLLLEKATTQPQLIDWETVPRVWNQDGILDIVNETVRNSLLTTLHTKSELSNIDAAECVLRYAMFEFPEHREACARRFPYATSAHREDFMARLGRAADDVQKLVVEEMQKAHSMKLDFVEELEHWSLDIKYRQQLCHSAVESSPLNVLRSWIENHLEHLIEHRSAWTLAVVRYAWLERKDYMYLPGKDTVKRLLGTQDDRAEITLQFMVKLKIPQSELKDFRQEIGALKDLFPDTVSTLSKMGRFKFRRK
jgi:Cdc6-like AAA superfamily ATPase